jgi:hypothetical protein
VFEESGGALDQSDHDQDGSQNDDEYRQPDDTIQGTQRDIPQPAKESDHSGCPLDWGRRRAFYMGSSLTTAKPAPAELREPSLPAA